jgi:hypothetical protein
LGGKKEKLAPVLPPNITNSVDSIPEFPGNSTTTSGASAYAMNPEDVFLVFMVAASTVGRGNDDGLKVGDRAGVL